MAYQPSSTNGGSVADATGHLDMLDKLIDFIDGTTIGLVNLPIGQRWTVLKDDSVTVPGERFVYLSGPGLSGTDSIHVNIRAYSNVGANRYNWEIRGATGFSTGLSFEDQPGGSTVESHFTMSNTTMPFWFVVSGRRIIVVAQTSGSVSYACYLGWYLPYATPAQFPYPMYNGANATDVFASYLTTNYEVGNFYDGPIDIVVNTRASGQLRDVNGVWYPWGTFRKSTGASRPPVSNTGVRISPHDSEEEDDESYGIVENVDGSFIFIPFILYSEDNGGNVFGELDGAFYSPLGLIGKKFPDTITYSGDTYLVLSNTYRTAEANAVILLK